MELLDRRINNYYNLANTRIMLMASNGVRLEAVINVLKILISEVFMNLVSMIKCK